MPSSAWSSDVCSSDRSEEHTSELQSLAYLVCRLLLEKKKTSELQSLAYLVCRLLLETKKTINMLFMNCVHNPTTRSKPYKRKCFSMIEVVKYITQIAE